MVGRHHVADVQVDRDRRAAAHLDGPREVVRAGELVGVDPRMVVHRHRHAVAVGVAGDAGDAVHVRRGGDGRRPEHLRHLEAAIDLGVREVVLEAEVVGVDLDAGVLELPADLLEVVEGDGRAPAPQPLAILGAAQLGRLHVSFPQLATRDAELLHRGDAVVEAQVAEAVALQADEDACETGLGLRGHRPTSSAGQHAGRRGRDAAERQPVPFTPGDLCHRKPPLPASCSFYDLAPQNAAKRILRRKAVARTGRAETPSLRGVSGR